MNAVDFITKLREMEKVCESAPSSGYDHMAFWLADHAEALRLELELLESRSLLLSAYEKISDQTYKDAALVSDNPLVNDLNALARGYLSDNYGRLRRFLETHSEPGK